MALESQPLSNEQMRRTWAMVDVLTSLKRRTNQAPPTADFIRRKFEALSIPATETLSILVALTLRKENCPLAHFHVYAERPGKRRQGCTPQIRGTQSRRAAKV